VGKPWEDYEFEVVNQPSYQFIDWFAVNHQRYTLEQIIEEREGWPNYASFHRSVLSDYIDKRRFELIKIWTEE